MSKISPFDLCLFCKKGHLIPHEPHLRIHGIPGYACDYCGRVFENPHSSEGTLSDTRAQEEVDILDNNVKEDENLISGDQEYRIEDSEEKH